MTVDDLADFLAEQGTTGPNCSVAAFMETLSDKDLSLFKAALKRTLPTSEGPAIQHKAISRWASKHNGRLNASTIARHRRGDCTCPKT